jgi:cyclophilin family peptidyl-prolyl cis-trans isomerase
MKNPVITITMEDGGVIKAELYPDKRTEYGPEFPEPCGKKNFYDGHHLPSCYSGFMIQGGDPEGTGMGGPGYSIAGEFESNGFQNDIKHVRGVLSMARAMDPDSAGSQFFIMHADAPLSGRRVRGIRLCHGRHGCGGQDRLPEYRRQRPAVQRAEDKDHDGGHVRDGISGS